MLQRPKLPSAAAVGTMTVHALSSRHLYLRLLGYVRPHWKVFGIALLCMAATALTEPIFPALMKSLLDTGFSGKGGSHVLLYPAFIIVLMLFRGIVGFLADYAMAWVSNRVVLDLRNAMFANLVRLPTRYFDDQSSGALMSKIAYDVGGVTSAATSVITVVVRDTLAVTGLLVWLLYINWALTMVALAMVPLITIAVKSYSSRLRRVSRASQEAMGKITHVLEEAIGAHKVMKIFGGQEYERARLDAANREQRSYNMRWTVASASLGPIVQVFAAIALAIIVGIALQQSANDRATVGSFVSFITAMLMLLAPMKRLTDVNAPLQRGLAAAESVFQLVDEPPEDDSGTVELGRARGPVAFKDVSFTYPGANRPALEHIDLKIRPGENIALVGASGSGKTTIANLLPRLYHVSSGHILIDGHNIEEVKLASLRANMALVSQDVVLFNDTVAANIAYGALAGTSRAQIEAAATAAYALEFIQALPHGFDSLVGENGVKLSGGQRQRLAIARALLKDAPILVLDEATSALDTESERQVQAALHVLMQGRTTIVIAHRLSTIEKADHIVVLSRGRVMEIGRHAELLARDGIYAKLYRIQFDESAQEAVAG